MGRAHFKGDFFNQFVTDGSPGKAGPSGSDLVPMGVGVCAPALKDKISFAHFAHPHLERRPPNAESERVLLPSEGIV